MTSLCRPCKRSKVWVPLYHSLLDESVKESPTPAELLGFLGSEMVRTLRSDAVLLRESLAEFNAGMLGWTRFRDSKDYKVFYKREPGLSSLSVSSRGDGSGACDERPLRPG